MSKFGRLMSDEEAIEKARLSGYGPIVKVPHDMPVSPAQIAVVDLRCDPPSVRWEDPIVL